MNSKLILPRALKLILILSLIFILLTNSFQLIIFSQRFYCYEFEKQGSFDKLAQHEVDCTIANTLTSYFKQKENNLIEVDFFNHDEKQHMLDVKVLINKTQMIYSFVLGIFILSLLSLFSIDKKEFKKNMGKIFLIAGLLTIILTITFILLSLNFNFLFTRFHELFFPQGNWTFHYDSNMIKLFPEGLFVDGFAWVLLFSVIQSFLLLLISFFVFEEKIKII